MSFRSRSGLMVLFLQCCCVGILFLSGGVVGMIAKGEKHDIRSDESVSRLWIFEYGEGGYLNMTVRLESSRAASKTNNGIQVFLMNKEQMDDLVKDFDINTACASEFYSRTESIWQTQLGKGYKLKDGIEMNITEGGWYQIIQLNCHADTYYLELDYTAINPGGEYLSLSEVPYKKLFAITAGIWALLTTLWSLHWHRYRFFNNKPQKLMTLIPGFKCLVSICLHIYWNRASDTGTISSSIFWPTLLFLAATRASLFYVLMLFSKGWNIIGGGLGSHDKVVVNVISILFFLSYIGFSVFQGVLFLVLVIVYISLLRDIFSSVAFYVSELLDQIAIVRRCDVDPSSLPIWRKVNMFRKLQTYVVCFVSFEIVFNLWATVFLQTMPWVNDAVSHLLVLLLFLYLCHLYGMRPFNPLYYSLTQETNGMSTDQISRSRKLVWRPGMGLPSTKVLNSKIYPTVLCRLPSEGLCPMAVAKPEFRGLQVPSFFENSSASSKMESAPRSIRSSNQGYERLNDEDGDRVLHGERAQPLGLFQRLQRSLFGSRREPEDDSIEMGNV